MFQALPARLGLYFHGHHLRRLSAAILLISLAILYVSATQTQWMIEATPHDLDPRVPYDSEHIIKLTMNAEKYQRNNGPPEKVYYDFVHFGQPPRSIKAIYDTGTSEIWYPKWTWNPFARNLVYLMGHRCSESVTCVGPASGDYELDYRGTRLSGEAYSDQLVLGSDMINYHYSSTDLLPIETKTGKITIKQRFLAIYSASNDGQKKDPYDAYMILGLAPTSEGLVSGSTTLLSNMQAAKKIVPELAKREVAAANKSFTGFIEKRAFGTLLDKEVFSFWFQPHGDKAEVLFGGTDKRKFSGQIQYRSLIAGATTWQMSGSQLWLGRRLLSKPQGFTFTMDTGVNDIYGPKDIVEELYKELKATEHENIKGIYSVDCNTAPKLPDLQFGFDDVTSLDLRSMYYIRTMNIPTDSFNLFNLTCYVSIRPHQQGGNNWILGTHFMEAFYTVFDLTNRRVGFANSK